MEKIMNEEQLYAMRHSLAHITAQAVQHLWPEAKFGVGPVVENGFYYDIDLGETKISEEDFPKIEAEMRKVIAADYSLKEVRSRLMMHWRGRRRPNSHTRPNC
jgi:threonyl-tRNA synthetase